MSPSPLAEFLAVSPSGPWRSAAEAVAERCTEAGFDLVQPFATDAVRTAIAPFALDDFGRDRALGLLVGNTAALWTPFTRDAPDGPDPLDRYTERRLANAAASSGVGHAVVFGHHVVPDATLPIQRLAEAAGLCVTAPCYASVHPTIGPWLALRAAITFDVDGPSPAPVRRAPCEGCPAPCVPALEEALATSARAPSSVAEHWRTWVAVRDACPVGREHRYPDTQLRYHYTKDQTLVR